jgi:predicted transglutaminase-like cysteine proteinase
MGRLASLLGFVLLSGGLLGCVAPDASVSAIVRRAESPAVAGSLVRFAETRGKVRRDAEPPSGFLAFCDRNPGECRSHRDLPGEIQFTEELRETLEKVNVVVNITLQPVDDSDHYGVAEFWTVPVDGQGDCEDYVLAKRKMLTLLGVPEQGLRITVVLDRKGVRHAVLTVVTDRGDFVLDNMNDEILAPEKTGYVWVERQDSASRTGWVAMN